MSARAPAGHRVGRDHPSIRGRSGRGVTVAVIDSGVHAEHPHVGSVAGGVAIEPDGETHADYLDRLGHGTAVTAAILDKAPDVDIQAVKVFGRTLATSSGALVKAIDWAVEQGAAHQPESRNRGIRRGPGPVGVGPPCRGAGGSHRISRGA